jgi:hypothetical protein
MSTTQTTTSSGCDALKNFIQKFENEMTIYASKNNSYSKWSSRVSVWEKEVGEFNYIAEKRKEFENRANETRVWNNCNIADRCSNEDQWCRNDFGSEFPVFIRCIDDPCWLGNKGICGRSERSKKSIMEEFQRYKLTQRPTTSGLPNEQDQWNENNRPQRPSVNFGQIVCCNQVIKDVDVLNGNISKEAITQKCQAQSTTKAPVTQAPVTQAPVTKPPEEPLQILTSITNQTFIKENQNIIILIIILIVLFCSSSIASLFFI